MDGALADFGSLWCDRLSRIGRHSSLYPLAVLLFTILIGIVSFKPCWPLQQPRCFTEDIGNSSLGFQNIFAISLPERSDRRDLLTLASSFTDFHFQWANGVRFEQVSSKAAPVNWDYASKTTGSLGCWRAHMDVLQHAVRSRIQTTLIIEDDSDFDISLKQQLALFAKGVRALQASPVNHIRSPYGGEWDFFWLGHCENGPAGADQPMYLIENDPTVVPHSKRHGLWTGKDTPDQVYSNSTRMVFRAGHGGLCTYAYAITYEGARKALAALSVLPQNEAVDVSFRHLCAGQLPIPFTCYGIYPTLFGSHRAAGPTSRDSDQIEYGDNWHEEYTYDVMYSVMQNVLSLASGNLMVKAQFPDQTETPFWPKGQVLSTRERILMQDLQRQA